MSGTTEPDVAGESLLERRLEIETPERVRITHDIAGIGSRFAAGFIDAFLLTILGCVAVLGVLLLGSVAFPEGEAEQAALGYAAAGVAFVILTVYYSFFELAWGGQTPGKRLLRLRVIAKDGGPAPATAILVRNVLRLVDAFPFAAPYGLGGIVMFVVPSARRIGDFAAGTIVVRERTEALAAPPRVAADGADAIAETDAERARDFVLRAPQLVAASRRKLASSIASDIAARHDLAFADAEQFLRAVAKGVRPSELRGAAGPRP
jgi:uncharacterized RDD family membrane protein YckC